MASVAPSHRDLGRTLRRARGRMGGKLEDAAAITRIPKRYLEALESNAPMEAYPAPVYARAFLREYARYLHLDPEPLLAGFGGPVAEPVRLGSIRDAVPAPRRWPAHALLAASIALLVALAAFGIHSSRTGPARLFPVRSHGHASAPAAHPKRISPAPVAATSGITAGVHVLGRSWVAVVADGTSRPGRIYSTPGWHRFTAAHTLLLTLGSAGDVRLVVNGKRYATGDPGQVVHISMTWKLGKLHVTRA